MQTSYPDHRDGICRAGIRKRRSGRPSGSEHRGTDDPGSGGHERNRWPRKPVCPFGCSHGRRFRQSALRKRGLHSQAERQHHKGDDLHPGPGKRKRRRLRNGFQKCRRPTRGKAWLKRRGAVLPGRSSLFPDAEKPQRHCRGHCRAHRRLCGRLCPHDERKSKGNRLHQHPFCHFKRPGRCRCRRCS